MKTNSDIPLPTDAATHHRTDAPSPCYGSSYGTGLPDGGAIAGILSPRRLLSAALRKWYLIALATALGVSAAWFYISCVTPLYRATSLIEMSVRRPRIMAQRGPVTDDTDFFAISTEEVFNTRIQKLRGSEMRELVAARIHGATNRPPWSSEQIGDVLDSVVFAMIRRSYLVSISCESPDPRLASMGANTYAEGAVQLSMEQNRVASDSAVAWLEQQANQQKRNLDTIAQAITTFREAKHIDAILNEKLAMQGSLASIGTQLTQLESSRILADKLLVAVKNVTQDPKNVGHLPDTTPRRDEIVQAVSKWLLASQERDALLARFTPDHPDVLARSKSIGGLGEQVAGTIRRAQSTAEANVLLLEQQTAGLRQSMETQSRAAAELEGRIIRVQGELGALERERNIADMSYKGLLTRIEEARISADEGTATVKVVERAVPPSKPFTLRGLRILFLALVLGLAGGCGLVLLVEMIEDRFVGTDDLERALGLPVLGLVPRLQGRTRPSIGRVAYTDRFGIGAEAYAGLRAKIMSGAADTRPACLLVTSAGQHEGKTITASNLAIAFARTGVKTLLVDFDMRRPKVRSVFGLPENGPCLLETLGKGKVQDFACLPTPTDCPRLFVVGTHASKEISAAEVMGSRIVKDFIAWARSSYEMVILDSPPFGVVSDALVLAGMSDGVLFVSRPGVGRRHSLRNAIEEFSEAGAPLLGVVVNGVNFHRLSFLSNYDYRYGRGYQSYTYSTRDKKK
jgi:capsular exopolysaccharide synthesis family protein